MPSNKSEDRKRTFLEEELEQFEETGSFDDTGFDLGNFEKSIAESLLKATVEPEEKGKKSKKKKKKQKGSNLKTSRIVGCVFTGIAISIVLVGVVTAVYTKYIRFPVQMEINSETTGGYCLDVWEDSLYNLQGVEEGYIGQELGYANGDEYKEKFLKSIASTVSYNPSQIEAKNVYGNTMIDRKTGKVVYMDSDLRVGEEVELTYVDYSKIDINPVEVGKLLEKSELKVGDVDYSNKLVDVFCEYISGIKSLPTKTVSVVPNMVLNSNNTYSMTLEEDIFIDKLLYSSEEFHKLIDSFSVVAGGGGEENPEWVNWDKLSDKKKEKKEEPEKYLSLKPTSEWSDWNKLSEKKKKKVEEPEKYNWKDMMSKVWCGSYYLQNEYTELDEDGTEVSKVISAECGDGTLENPAGLNTSVLTSVFVREKNKKGKYVTKERPIKIKMIEFGVSEDAIAWFEGKAEQNRGINLDSEVQYCYYVFEITNMSNKKLKISDNTTLCDKNANVASRTGTIYGLTSSVTLKPDEVGKIETWGRSTELNKKYVIWGKDFARRIEPVWFRVLAGNIDDPSEEKGVRLNKTRQGESISDSIDSVEEGF